MDEVTEVLAANFGHLRLGRLDPLAVFFKVFEQDQLRSRDWKERTARSQRTGLTDLQGDLSLFRDLLGYARLADVAYAGDEATLAQGLRRLEWRLLSGTVEVRPQRPAHFVAVQGRKVVLGVAGTHSVADCLTDCLCDGQAFEQGVAHRGAAEAANWLCEEHGELLKALEEAGHDVVLVGHSLGAAVAAACCVQLRRSTRARCVCLAPPATVDPRLAREAEEYITSVVHDDDIIPRMQIRSLLALYKELLAYNWLKASKSMAAMVRADPHRSWILELGDTAFGTLEDQLEAFWKDAGQQAQEPPPELALQDVQALSIPGFIVHLYRSPSGYGVIKASAKSFEKIEMSSSMITDHFLDGYISSLESLVHGMEAAQEGQLRQLEGVAEATGIDAQQVHKAFLSVEELLLRARSRLQARPDTS